MALPRKLTYSKVLAIWTEFIINSGGRAYCQTECKGRCCKEVHCTQNATKDYSLCPESLSCVQFMCPELMDHLKIPRGVQFSYDRYDSYIRRQYRDINPNDDIDPHNVWGRCHSDLTSVKWHDPRPLIAKLLKNIGS